MCSEQNREKRRQGRIMKRISLKLKLTLLYTFFMVLLTCAALAILFSLSNREVLSSTQSKLERRVQESVEDISLRNGEIRIDSDFYSIVRDVYLSLYSGDMYFMYGRVPRGFGQQPELADGQMQTIRDGNMEWYVYDMSYRLSDDQTVYIRGITSITDAEESFTVTLRFALILLPLMVLATAVIGYRFTRRTLLPVRKMTETVRQIRADADLSRRIGFEETGGRRDRDEIYILGRTFDEMLGELEEVFRREQQFTSDASHELRTPVSVILAQCDAMLAEDNAFTEEQREQIRLIRRKAQAMADMIAQLLFLSRADQGRQPLRREHINVSELTEMISEEQQMLAEARDRGIRVETKISPEIWMDVDETFYIRMLVNLLSNAIRYSREDGRVEVALEKSGNMVIGSVRDYGTGISQEDLPHIWERFYQADASRTGESHAGLGLSMVRWIAEAHGGSVSAESTEGKGSIFTFRIPAEENISEKNEKM